MAKVKVNGKVYTIPEDPTLGQAQKAEQLARTHYGEASAVGMGIVNLYLAMHGEDPAVTLEQVENLRESEIENIEEDEAGPPARRTTKKKSA